MSKLRAGILALAILAVFGYFGFTKANPFSNPYELTAVFDNVNNLKPRSPVRIAGVEVGKVKKVTAVTEGEGAAKVTMEIKDKGLPIHDDAEAHVRSRIFLEGNFFVDLRPGSPSAPEMKNGGTIPIQQTAAPVQFGQVLSALQNDTREDLKSFLKEYSKGLEGKGAKGFNDSIKYWETAYRNAALANDATLGQEPTKDLQRVLKGQQKTFAALVENEEALKGLVTNFNTTAGAFASQDAALEASIPELRDTLRAAQPALASLNAALPTLRAFSRDALPGVQSSGPTIDASMPFIQQARALVSPRELRGTAAVLRKYIPDLVTLNKRSVPLASEGRSLSRCVNEVLVPFIRSTVPSHEQGNTGQQVRFQIQRSFPGLSGESRLSDGNTQYFHGSAVPNPLRIQPVPPSVIDQPPERRPDVPCETQEKPNLEAPNTTVATLGGGSSGGGSPLPPLPLPAARSFKAEPLMQARKLMEELSEKRQERWTAEARKDKREAGK